MSGVEAVGLIASVITILDVVIKSYDACKDARGLPAAFREVAVQLPVARSILEAAEKKIDQLDQNKRASLEPLIENCKIKADALEKLFKKAISEDGTSDVRRYCNAVVSVGKSSKVEKLMADILKYIGLLDSQHLQGFATKGQMDEISKAINLLSEIEPSVPDEAFNDSVTGHYNSGTGSGNYNYGSGSSSISHGGNHYSTGGAPMHFGSTPSPNPHA